MPAHFALVTGGCGFIGQHIIDELLAQSGESTWRVRVVDSLVGSSSRECCYCGQGDGASALPMVECIHEDLSAITSHPEWLDGITHVFHCAALVSVPESMDRPSAYVSNNVLSTLALLEACVAANAIQSGTGSRRICKLVFSSTAAVYGEPHDIEGDDVARPTVSMHESLPFAGKSPYAMTKWDCEFFCRLFDERHDLATVCLRYFNVFGPRQDPRSAYAAVVPVFIERAKAGEDVVVYGDGTQTRDFVYVKDVAKANVFVATHEHVRGIFNVGYGKAMTIEALARAIISMVGSDSRIVHLPSRLGDIMHSVCSNSKLLHAGWKPQFSFEKGLQETVAASILASPSVKSSAPVA